MSEKKQLRIKLNVTVDVPDGIEVLQDEQGTIVVRRDLEFNKEQDDFLELLKRIAKRIKRRMRIVTRSTKGQVLGLERIYRLNDPR